MCPSMSQTSVLSRRDRQAVMLLMFKYSLTLIGVTALLLRASMHFIFLSAALHQDSSASLVFCLFVVDI